MQPKSTNVNDLRHFVRGRLIEETERFTHYEMTFELR